MSERSIQLEISETKEKKRTSKDCCGKLGETTYNMCNIRDLKIRRLRTTTTVKHAIAHDQNQVTVHFSRVVLRLRWVVELFLVVATTENILLAFCRLGNSRISFLFAAAVFWRSFFVLPLENKIHIFSPPCNILYIYSNHSMLWPHFYLKL